MALVDNVTAALTNITETDDGPRSTFDFERQPGLVFVIVASSCASLWLFYITFYHCRVLGMIVTKLLSKFYFTDGYFYVGSFSVSLLSGKFMFRDIKYITKDYSLRIVDGYGIFKWWLQFNPDEIKTKAEKPKDFLVADNRVILQINGFELHFYNRSSIYEQIQESLKVERYGDAGKSAASLNVSPVVEEEGESKSEFSDPYNIRSLIPSIGVNINAGKVAIGNKTLETTLWMHFNHASATYATPAAACPLDEFCNLVQCRFEDFRILLSPSPGHPGLKVQPPRFMGEGFVLLQSGEADVCYYQDQPGFVPEVSEEGVVDADPTWGIDVTFTKNTTMTYGPWADSQRESLQKFFLPHKYQEEPITKALAVGQRRLHNGLDLKIDFKAQCTIDILFSKDEETSALHISTGAASSLNYYVPWTINEYGYMSSVFVQLQQVELSSSLEYRNILISDSLDIAINMTIPRMWNHFQHWTCELSFRQTSFYLIYQLKEFFKDVFNDWASTDPYDVAHFIPYEWTFNFIFTDFEVICFANQHNWIDCTNEEENSQVAFCGETLEISFALPFTRFLPSLEEIRIFFQAETLIARSFLPSSNTLRRSVSSLARYCNQDKTHPSIFRLSSATSEKVPGDDFPGNNNISDGWFRKTAAQDGWIDVWSVPFLGINLSYQYHPMPVVTPQTLAVHKKLGVDFSKIKATSLEPDIITVELEAGPSALHLYGSFLRQFIIGLKENYFGVSQVPAEFNATKQTKDQVKNQQESVSSLDIDPRQFRPFEANITVVLLDIKAELSKHCLKGQPMSPILHVNRLTFEMNKTFSETRMQLILSPATVVIKDSIKRNHEQQHLNHGHISLSGLQFRGHAMFSDKGLNPDQDTLEYAWLTEIQCGEVTGKATPAQLQSIACWLETFALHTLDEENVLIPQSSIVYCQHSKDQSSCTAQSTQSNGCISNDETTSSKSNDCLTEDDLKYRMTRVSVEKIQLFVVESEVACSLLCSPLRIATCTSHANAILEGASLFINEIAIKQYIQVVNSLDPISPGIDPTSIIAHTDQWLEVGSALFGPLTVDIATLSSNENHRQQQNNFLKIHDRLTKRLWFLWKPDLLSSRLASDRANAKICGCVGGCGFFGANVNGVRFFSTQCLDADEAKYARYGSESLWGGCHEKQMRLKERFHNQSILLTSPSYGSGFQSSTSGRQPFGHQRSTSHGGPPQPKNARATNGNANKTNGSTRSFEVSRSDRTPPSSASKRRKSSTRSRELGSTRGIGKMSRTESEMTFYSCESDLSSDEEGFMEEVDTAPKKKTISNMSLRTTSTSSFVSAMTSAHGSMNFDYVDGSVPFEPLIPSQLMDQYSEHLPKYACGNWRSGVNEDMKKKFSLTKNLKSISGPPHPPSAPTLPSFQTVAGGRLPFVVVNKTETEEDDNTNDHVFSPVHVSIEESATLSSGNNTIRISMKLHQHINLTVTPLFAKAIERYTKSLLNQRTLQHPAYIIDSIHMSCISSSKNEYNKCRALSELQRCNGNAKLVEVHFPTVATVFNASIPQVNFVMFQLSDDFTRHTDNQIFTNHQFEMSNSDISESSCKGFLAGRLMKTSIDVILDGSDTSLFNAKVSFMQRGYCTEDNATDLWNSKQKDVNTSGVVVKSKSMEVQIQRLLSTNMPSDGHTSIPSRKSAVGFCVMRGEDVDIDDISLIEPRSSDPIGLIVLECSVNQISFSALSKDTLEKLLISKNTSESTGNFSKQSSRGSHGDSKRLHHEYGNPLFFKQMSVVEPPKFVEHNADFIEDETLEPLLLSEETSFTTKTMPEKRKISTANKHRSVSGVSESQKPLQNRFIEILSSSDTNLSFADIWLDIATPSQLCPQKSIDDNVNLVSTLAPACICWLTVSADLSKAIKATLDEYNVYRSSVLACGMSQALPEPGRLLKKHNITSKATPASCFLQEEYSGQLIFVLRRHFTSTRLAKLFISLQEDIIPPRDTIDQGIDALARQWKCVIIGAETNETMFDSKRVIANKKHVVGRGILTQRDLAFLMQDPTEEKGTDHQEATDQPTSQLYEIGFDEIKLGTAPTSPVSLPDTDSRMSLQKLKAMSSTSLSHSQSGGSEVETDRLLQSRQSRTSAVLSPDGKDDLYQLISQSTSPTARTISQNTSQHLNKNDDENETATKGVSQMAELLRSSLPMVSVPTSGMQLAEASNVFAAIFKSVNLKKAHKSKRNRSSRSKFSFNLKQLQVHLIDAQDEPHRSVSIPRIPSIPAFDLVNLNACITSTASDKNQDETELFIGIQNQHSPSINEQSDGLISIDCVSQKFNIASIRLLTQIVETTLAIVSEKKYASSLHYLEQLNTQDFASNETDAVDGVTVVESPRDVKSWKTMYNVLNLYRTLPSFGRAYVEETRRRAKKSQAKDKSKRRTGEHEVRITIVDEVDGSAVTDSPHQSKIEPETVKAKTVERSSLNKVCFVFLIKKANLHGTVGGLSLAGELKDLSTSFVKRKTVNHTDVTEPNDALSVLSISSHLHGCDINLSETSRTPAKPIIECMISTSHVLYSEKSSNQDPQQTLTVNVGPIKFHIPQHPGIMRSVTSRFSKQLQPHFVELDNYRKSKKLLQTEKIPRTSDINNGNNFISTNSAEKPSFPLSFRVYSRGVFVSAALLPSLHAEYRIKKLTSNGVYEKSKSSFHIELPTHGISFEAKNQSLQMLMAPITSIELPSINVNGKCENYLSKSTADKLNSFNETLGDTMQIAVDIGKLEQTVTTDLMNNMIYLQKGFVKEVNEVIEKSEKEDVPFWVEAMNQRLDSQNHQPLQFCVTINLQGIVITATTPSSTALRLQTGLVTLELTNKKPEILTEESQCYMIPSRDLRLFGKAKIDLMISLGHFIKGRGTDEDVEFEHLAYFKSKILLSNTVEDRLVLQQSEGKETVIITLSQPRLFVLPPAVDKGVLVYLYYKNAYEYWNEQLLLLADQVQSATQQFKVRLPQRSPSPQSVNLLFMQLNVDNFAVCIPLFDEKSMELQGSFSTSEAAERDPCAALIITIAESSITCCSSGCFVSRGLFRDFCLRFTSGFDYNASAWQLNFPDMMNTLSVFEGTYELCSKTNRGSADDPTDQDCWVMSIVWKMCGFDANVDASIGKRLSALGLALTAFTKEADVADLASVADDYCSDSDDEIDGCSLGASMDRSLNGSMNINETSPLHVERHNSLERQLWEQTRKVNELRRSNASPKLINHEVYILRDIEAALSNAFFRGVRQRFRRQTRGQSSGMPDKPLSRSGASDVLASQTTDPRKSFSRRHSSSENYTDTIQPPQLRRQRFSTTDKHENLFSGSGPIKIEIRPPISEDGNDHDDLSQTFSDPLIFSRSDAVFNSASEDKYSESNCENVTPRVTFSKSTADVRDGGPASTAKSTASTSLDFELDLVVGIESGRCVFHADHGTPRQQPATDTTPVFRPLGDNHTRKISDQTDQIFARERSFNRFSDGSGGSQPQSNPGATQRSMSYQVPPRRLKSSASLQTAGAGVLEDTVLLVPAIDLRSHYKSKTNSDPKTRANDSATANSSCGSFMNSSETVDSNGSPPESTVPSKLPGSKFGGLHVWISVQQLPREMILRPSLLDFIEKALMPITIPMQADTGETASGGSMSSSEGNAPTKGNVSSVVSSSATEYSSFPVDIVVLVRVQPSDVRFSCLPISKVECLLRIPSLDVVISSKPMARSIACRQQQASSSRRTKTSQTSISSTATDKSISESVSGSYGGLTFTVCLSRFSFCVFHPYGKQFGSTSDSRSFTEGGMYAGKRKVRTPVQPISGRKDSLSLNVEFVKFNLVRRRIKSTVPTGKLRRSFSGEENKTTIKVSVICDIGSASFNYDMRRLNEILDVPKAWYRSELYRRMFLGKEGSYATKAKSTPQNPDSFVIPSGSDPLLFSESFSSSFRSPHNDSLGHLTTPTKSHQTHRRAVSGSILGNIMTPPFISRSATVGSRGDAVTRSNSARLEKRKVVVERQSPNTSRDKAERDSKPQSSSSQTSQTGLTGAWETNVIIALNLARMDVAANMGNVMGQAIWNTTDLRCQSRYLVNNSGTKTMNSTISVGQGSFDAHGGIVGGFIEVQDIFSQGNFEENLDCLPSHELNLGMRAGEVRIDYMGSCIFMASISAFRTDLHDDWILPNLNVRQKKHKEFFKNSTPSQNGSKDPNTTNDIATILINGEIAWSEFQLVMSRSTTPDLYKMVAKLGEFLNQQHRSGVRALSSMHSSSGVLLNQHSLGRSPYTSGLRHETDSHLGSDIVSSQRDGLKYQHWVEILNALTGLNLNNVVGDFASNGVILGGSLALKGDFLSLACFHGSNFRAQHWALFSMREPFIEFNSKLDVVEKSCQVKRAKAEQELVFYLGHHGGTEKRTKSPSELYDFMATVRKVSRGRRNPPSLGAPVHEWLNFVNSTTDEELPSSVADNQKSSYEVKSHSTKQTIQRKVSFAPKFRYENESEIIFALPQLTVRMLSKHDQPMTSRLCDALITSGSPVDDVWLSTVPSPHVVNCHFDSVFKDCLDVTMDVGLLFFLHDLILAYLKEKETYLTAAQSRSLRTSSQSLQRQLSNDANKQQTKQQQTEAKNTNRIETSEKYRHFKCDHWKVEPRIRLLSWAGKRMDPVSIDWVLEKLGFMDAALTIPKWLQRGAMDPIDITLSIIVQKLLASMMNIEAIDNRTNKRDGE